jgi:hypothetical protein
VLLIGLGTEDSTAALGCAPGRGELALARTHTAHTLVPVQRAWPELHHYWHQRAEKAHIQFLGYGPGTMLAVLEMT